MSVPTELNLLKEGHCQNCKWRPWILERVARRLAMTPEERRADTDQTLALQTGDTHIDFHPKFDVAPPGGIGYRRQDFTCAACGFTREVIRHKPKLTIHTGDVFETAVPTNYGIVMAKDMFRIMSLFTEALIIASGNHDAPRQSSTKPILLNYAQDAIVITEPRLHELTFGDVRVVAIPHTATQERFEKLLQEAKADPRYPVNILVIHGMITSIAPAIEDGGTTRYINEELIDPGFSHTAVGDVHQMRIGRRWAYSGSLEKQDISEAKEQKYYLKIHLDRLADTSQPYEAAIEPVKVQTRAMIDYPLLDLTGVTDIGEAQARIEAAMTASPLEGKIARLVVKGLPFPTYKALDKARLDAIKDQALLFHLSFIEMEGEESVVAEPEDIGDLETEFERFAAGCGLAGDLERVHAKFVEHLRLIQAKNAEEGAKAS